VRGVAAVLTLGIAAAAAWAQIAPGDAARDRERELEGIRIEIARLAARLETTRRRAEGIEGELERLAIELDLQQHRVDEAEAAHEVARQRVEQAEERIRDLESRLAAERVRLEERVGGLYRLGRHGMMRLAFSLHPGDDPVASVRLLRYLALRDAESVRRFEELRARLAVERSDLDRERTEAEGWLAQQSARRDELQRLRARQREVLAGTRNESARIALRARELEERAERLSALLDALYGRSTDALQDRPIQEFRGLLAWPARGRVTTEFGPRLDPRYGTRIPHNGVDLATVPGEPVRSVYPGRVVFAAPFEGYGPTVVVQHAGRAFTLYAGLERISVDRGDLLSLDAVLGTCGASLYFEIRVENRPEDPSDWVR